MMVDMATDEAAATEAGCTGVQGAMPDFTAKRPHLSSKSDLDERFSTPHVPALNPTQNRRYQITETSLHFFLPPSYV